MNERVIREQAARGQQPGLSLLQDRESGAHRAAAWGVDADAE